MKKRQNELDVDFIGGQGSLTNDEANMISEFIKSEKAKSQRIQEKRTIANTKRTKTTA